MSETIIFYEKHNAVINATLSDNKLTNILIDEKENVFKVGNVFIGHVNKVIAHLNAAYVDIGLEKPCYMELKQDASYLTANHHPDNRIHAGDDLVVQISKDPIKTKPATVSPEITITRRLVILSYSPKDKSIRFSSKIKNSELKKTLTDKFNAEVPKDYSLLFRTNCENATVTDIESDYKKALTELDRIVAYASTRTKGTLVWESDPKFLQTIKDGVKLECDNLITDSVDIYVKLKDYLADNQPELLDKLTFRKNEDYPVEKLFDMKKHLKDIINQNVWLKSGAQVVIQPTEALVSIDVNSAKASAELKNFKDGFMQINIEAAREIRRQLILRNLSGVIIVDFINDRNHSRKELLEKVKEIFKSDNDIKVEDITKLGLIEITRMRKLSTTEEKIKKHHLLED